MALVNNTIPGLYGGVSQQTPELRHATQVSEMINCYPTVIGGISKRPPTVNNYNDNTFPTDAFIYAYDRGAGNEQYVIAINSNSQYRFFDIINNDWINSWTTHSYLALPSGKLAKDNFSLSTVGDTTFIVNKTKIPAMSTTVDYNGDSDWDTTFYYWVKRTNGDATDNASLRYTYYIYNAAGTEVASVVNHDSTEAATALASAIGSATAKGSVLKRTNATGYAGADSWGNQASESWVSKIKKLQDLPTDFGFEGAVIEVTGDEDSNFDNYYVKYEDGVYLETFKPGLQNSFNTSTMPHKIELRKLDNGTYYQNFDVIEWEDRKVGDENSAGEPSFIGQEIQDVFFYRNRLGFICGDNVVLSESGEYYNFWPTTVTSIIDSDMIDVAVDSNQAISLRYATPFNKELLIFGDKAQFVMSTGDTLTPTDVSVQQSTAFNIKSVEPVVLGPNAYFATEKNEFSNIREYYVQPDSLSNDAANITAHCPNYLPKNITVLTGSSANDMLFALSSDTPDTVYVYNFYWNGEEKAQSAWHKWTFAGDVFNIKVIGSTLLVMIQREDDTINLETIALEFRTDFSNIMYLDGGVESYESSITLTRPGFPTGNDKIDDSRGTLILRNLKVNSDYGSLYNVTAYRFNKPRNYYYNSGIGQYPAKTYISSKSFEFMSSEGTYPSQSLLPSTSLVPGATTYKMKTDHKYSITGNRDNLDIVFTNDISAGFRINSLDLVGTYVKNSRNV